MDRPRMAPAPKVFGGGGIKSGFAGLSEEARTIVLPLEVGV